MASGSGVLRRLLHLSAGNCLLLLLLLLLFLCGQLGGGQKKKEVEHLLLSPSRPAEGSGLPRRASSPRLCPGEGLRPPAPWFCSPRAPQGPPAGRRAAAGPRPPNMAGCAAVPALTRAHRGAEPQQEEIKPCVAMPPECPRLISNAEAIETGVWCAGVHADCRPGASECEPWRKGWLCLDIQQNVCLQPKRNV